MSYKVKFIPKFEKELKRMGKKFPSLKTDFALLLKSLKENPSQGTPLGNECYKIRMAIAGKEKENQEVQGLLLASKLLTELFICLLFSIKANRTVSMTRNFPTCLNLSNNPASYSIFPAAVGVITNGPDTF